VTAVAVPVNVADVAPAETVTDAGTVSFELLLERETAAPPVEAEEVKETVQAVVPAPAIVVGIQDKVLSCGAAVGCTVTEAVRDIPEAAAVRVTD
jgi:hypothetical protein